MKWQIEIKKSKYKGMEEKNDQVRHNTLTASVKTAVISGPL